MNSFNNYLLSAFYVLGAVSDYIAVSKEAGP